MEGSGSLSLASRLSRRGRKRPGTGVWGTRAPGPHTASWAPWASVGGHASGVRWVCVGTLLGLVCSGFSVDPLAFVNPGFLICRSGAGDAQRVVFMGSRRSEAGWSAGCLARAQRPATREGQGLTRLSAACAVLGIQRPDVCISCLCFYSYVES